MCWKTKAAGSAACRWRGGEETTLATDLNQGRQLAQARLLAAGEGGFLVRGE